MLSLQRIFLAADRRLAVAVVITLAVASGLLAGTYMAALSPLWGTALLLALGAGLLMLRDSQWGFVALIGLICLLPFGALPFSIGFTPTFLDIALLAIYLVWIVRVARGRTEPPVLSRLGLPVIVFMLLACASFVAGLGHARADSYVVRHFAELLLSIGLFFAALNLVRTRPQLRLLVIVLLLAGFAAALIGVALYFMPRETSIRLLSALGRLGYPTGAGVLRYIEDDPSLPLRAISTSTDPNVLGGLLILVTTLTAAQVLQPKPLLRRLWLVPMLLVELACLYLTYSRGSMLGLAAGLGMLALVRYRKLLPVLLLAAGALLLLPQTQTYVQHLFEGLQRQDQATLMRLGEYKDAFTLIQRHPWIGVGFVATPESSLYIGVSNVYLLIAEEMGLVGLGVFLLILGLFGWEFARTWPRLRQDSELGGIVLGLGAALAGILVGGILDHYFFNLNFPHSVSIFWLYLGLAVAAMRLGSEP